jgi:hypothetical protein
MNRAESCGNEAIEHHLVEAEIPADRKDCRETGNVESGRDENWNCLSPGFSGDDNGAERMPPGRAGRQPIVDRFNVGMQRDIEGAYASFSKFASHALRQQEPIGRNRCGCAGRPNRT